MAAPTPQQTAIGQADPIASVPPAYSENQPLGEGQPGPMPYTQVQIGAGQTWPPGYPVSS